MRIECKITVHQQSDPIGFVLTELLITMLTESLSEASIAASQIVASGSLKLMVFNVSSAPYSVSNIYLHMCIYTDQGFCNPDVTNTRYGIYYWSETVVGMTPQRFCVFGSETGEAFVSRRCEGINQWANGINPGECFS